MEAPRGGKRMTRIERGEWEEGKEGKTYNYEDVLMGGNEQHDIRAHFILNTFVIIYHNF